jgi:hypothetical protein
MIEKTGRRGRRRKQLLHDFKKTKKVLELEIGCIRLHFLENLLWKRLWTCGGDDAGRISIW